MLTGFSQRYPIVIIHSLKKTIVLTLVSLFKSFIYFIFHSSAPRLKTKNISPTRCRYIQHHVISMLSVTFLQSLKPLHKWTIELIKLPTKSFISAGVWPECPHAAGLHVKSSVIKAQGDFNETTYCDGKAKLRKWFLNIHIYWHNDSWKNT